MGQGREVYRFLVRKPEGKSPLGRPRRRWEDNIKMDLQEVGGGCGDWMELAQDRDRWRALVSTVMNLRVPKMRGISWLAAEPVSFSRRTLLHGVSIYIYNPLSLQIILPGQMTLAVAFVTFHPKTVVLFTWMGPHTKRFRQIVVNAINRAQNIFDQWTRSKSKTQLRSCFILPEQGLTRICSMELW